MVRYTRTKEDVIVPLLRPLFNDLVECEDGMERENNQFWKRAYARASFAFFEGYIFWYRGELRSSLERKVNLKIEEQILTLMALQDVSPSIDGTGRMTPEPNRMSFTRQCAFTIRTAANLVGLDSDALFSDNGWRCFRDAQKLRNRITHPKSANELDITDIEIDMFRVAHTWLLNCIVDVINAKAD